MEILLLIGMQGYDDAIAEHFEVKSEWQPFRTRHLKMHFPQSTIHNWILVRLVRLRVFPLFVVNMFMKAMAYWTK